MFRPADLEGNDARPTKAGDVLGRQAKARVDEAVQRMIAGQRAIGGVCTQGEEPA